VPRNVM